MQIRLTTILLPDGGARLPDAVARAEATGAETTARSGERLFLPGWLGCGECSGCRRGLPGICPRGRAAWQPTSDGGPPEAVVEVPDRYLTPIDQPAGVAELPDDVAAFAGDVAQVLDTCARAGLAPGDTAVWCGGDRLSRVGASWCASRSCRAIIVDDEGAAEAWGTGIAHVALGGALPSDGDPTGARGAERRGELRIFVSSPEAKYVAAALSLAQPGATISFLSPPSEPFGEVSHLGGCRILFGAGYHPDFVPEALAALRRGEAPSAALLSCVEPEVEAATVGAVPAVRRLRPRRGP